MCGFGWRFLGRLALIASPEEPIRNLLGEGCQAAKKAEPKRVHRFARPRQSGGVISTRRSPGLASNCARCSSSSTRRSKPNGRDASVRLGSRERLPPIGGRPDAPTTIAQSARARIIVQCRAAATRHALPADPAAATVQATPGHPGIAQRDSGWLLREHHGPALRTDRKAR